MGDGGVCWSDDYSWVGVPCCSRFFINLSVSMICELRVRQRLRSVAFCRPTDLVARALVVSSTQCSSRCFSALHPYSHACKTTMTVRTCDSNPPASATPTRMQNRRIATLTSSLSDRRSNHAGANADERGGGECISSGGRGPWTTAALGACGTCPVYFSHRPMRVGPHHQLRVLLQLRGGGCVRRDQHD